MSPGFGREVETVSRIYDSILAEHLAEHRQMALVTGPRQVGKTTTCRAHADHSLNWDDLDDRQLLLGSTAGLAQHLGLDRLTERIPVALFDELHKDPRWKQFLKGFFDRYADRVRILVTSSSRLDIYRRVGDSMMGRYFLYHMHPFSVAETLHTDLPDPQRIIRAPREPKAGEFEALWEHGGYPDPFLRRDARFSRRWQALRAQQLLREDVRDLTRIQQLDQLALLVKLLDSRSAHRLVYSNLATDVRVSGRSRGRLRRRGLLRAAAAEANGRAGQDLSVATTLSPAPVGLDWRTEAC